MPIPILVALISAVGAIAGSVFGVWRSTNIITYRLDLLDDKVQKHNNFVERVYALEKQAEVQNEKMKTANHRIDDLEKEKGN